MNTQVSFGQWLKQRRKALNLTQDEFSRRVGCAASMLQKIEADERRPSPQMAEGLAKALGIALGQFPTFVEFARAGRRASASALFHPPGNLPAPATSLIGRERDLAAVCQRLMREDTRLLTLLGPPGIGKTRLALQAAAQVRDSFDDGAFLVELASITDPDLVALTIAQTLSLKAGGAQSPVESLAHYLCDKLILLILDNLEQIIGCAPMVARLLAACPQLKLLATSRVPLRIRAERQWPVSPLTLPDLAHLPPPESLTDYSACALFVDRAQAVQPDFAVTPSNAESVARLCHRLDGLPLAIELIAARIKLMTPPALLERLGKLLLRSDGLHDIDERQRTLQNAVEWSYNLLAPEEQTLFARLAVFVGGWTLPAAESVCAEPEARSPARTLDQLAALVNQSLVLQHTCCLPRELRDVHEQGQGERDGERRFAFLEMIREYARERLEATVEAEALRQRHADYYLGLAEQAEGELTGPQQAAWLARLERELGNLRAALTWALSAGRVELAARACGALWRFWYLRGYMVEGRRWLDQVLRAPESAALALPVRAKVLNAAGILAWALGEYTQASPLIEECLALRRQLGDKLGAAHALNNLGLIAQEQYDYARAQVLHQASLALYRELGEKRSAASALSNLGLTALRQGQIERAAAFCQESLALARELGDKSGIANILNSLGGIQAEYYGDYAQATALLEQSLAICRELGGRFHVMLFTLVHLGRVALFQGDYQRANVLLQECLTLAREWDNTSGTASALKELGHVALRQGQVERAAELFKASLALYRGLDYKFDIADCLEKVASVAISRQQFATAVTLLGAAEATREAIHTRLLPADRAEHDRTMAATRDNLEQAAFAVAWAKGQAMPMEQAVAHALVA